MCEEESVGGGGGRETRTGGGVVVGGGRERDDKCLCGVEMRSDENNDMIMVVRRNRNTSRNINSSSTTTGEESSGGGGGARRRFRISWGGMATMSALVLLLLALLAPYPALCSLSSSSDESSSSSGSTLVSQSEVKTIEPTNNPTKVFVRRRIFRKLVKDQQGSGASSEVEPTTTTTSSPPSSSSSRPRSLYSLVKRLDNSSPASSGVTTGNTLKTSMSSSQSLSSKQKFNFQSLKTRLGIAAGTTTTTSTSTTTAPTTVAAGNNASSSLVMIPLPPNQRKPYTPVIMQVSKSTTAKPSTTVHTYKLNKMFVPIGIYGKVVENGTDSSSSTTEASLSSSSAAPSTEIRHKGTDDSAEKKGKKSARRHKGIADSVDITYAKRDPMTVSLTTSRPNIAGISITTEANELFGGILGGNGLRRRDQYNNNNKKPFSSSSGLTLMTPPALGGGGGNHDSEGSYSSYSTFGGNHYSGLSGSSGGSGGHKKFHPSAIVESITDSMSRIPSLVPSLFHKGLTSLASMTSSLKENPFVDDNFSESLGKNGNSKRPLVSAPSSYSPKIPASVPGGYIKGMTRGSIAGGGGGSSSSSSKNDQAHSASEHAAKHHQQSGGESASNDDDLVEYETLEYFRKRPHLLAQLQKASAWRRSQGVRFSKGFKPATASDVIAREYYKSTSTTAMTPEPHMRSRAVNNKRNNNNKKRAMRGNWLLRNSDEYVANRNQKMVRMWRNMLESLTSDSSSSPDVPPPHQQHASSRTFDASSSDSSSSSSKSTRSEKNTPSSSSLTSRKSDGISGASSSSGSSPFLLPSSVLNAEWSSIKRKYSNDQINEAKERILTLLNSGYDDEALLEDYEHHGDGPPLSHPDEEVLQHDLEFDTHMPPPPPHHGGHHGYSGGSNSHIHVQPPRIASLTKGLSGAAAGAFKDLVKLFKFGVSVGAGHAKEPISYEQVVDEQEGEEGADGGDWKPVARRPLISFSAGISVKNPLLGGGSKHHNNHHHHHGPPPPHHYQHHHQYQESHHGPPSHYYDDALLHDLDDATSSIHSSSLSPTSSTSHYSSSNKPYIPSGYKNLMSHYIDEYTSSHGGGPTSTPPSSTEALHPTPVSYAPYDDIPNYDEEGAAGAAADDDGGAYGSESSSHHQYAYSEAAAAPLKQHQRPSSSSRYYSTLKQKGLARPPPVLDELDTDVSPSDWSPVASSSEHFGTSGGGPSSLLGGAMVSHLQLPPQSSLPHDMSEYELVPSSVYLNGGHDPRDIAAVVKPAGISDALVRSALPAGLRNLRILDYPNEHASLNSVSQSLLRGSGGASGVSASTSNSAFKQAMKKLRENYVQKEAAYLPSGFGSSPLSAAAPDYYGNYNSNRDYTAAAYYNNPGMLYQVGGAGAGVASLSSAGGLASIVSGIGEGGESVFAAANRLVSGGSTRGLFQQQQQQQQQQQYYSPHQAQTSSGSQKDALGFTSNYNLPQNLDPDIAAILKSELDKDDIPEEIRKEFLEAKQQEEKQKKQKQQQQAAYAAASQASSNRRVDMAHQKVIDSLLSTTAATTMRTAYRHQASAFGSSPSPPSLSYQQQYRQSSSSSIPAPPTANPRSYSRGFNNNNPPPPFPPRGHPGGPPPMVTTRFFAPIPITPTLMTTALKNPRYGSPVPRYVIELAKKLQTDKTVQGIVRVSAKRGRGLPPIEYLYPVKG